MSTTVPSGRYETNKHRVNVRKNCFHAMLDVYYTFSMDKVFTMNYFTNSHNLMHNIFI